MKLVSGKFVDTLTGDSSMLVRRGLVASWGVCRVLHFVDILREVTKPDLVGPDVVGEVLVVRQRGGEDLKLLWCDEMMRLISLY